MYFINKISSGSAIDFAAEELKKYLRMMMPDGETFNILYNPEAVEGYRLGLMSDFGLDTSDAEDTELDDIIYIDTKGKSGIIAGSNPRSVLIAVYEYLRQNGCEWVMPGIDGEIIPLCEVCDVKYRFKPSMRCRGWVFEGCSFQRSELEAVDYMLKLGLNAFMIQFKFPRRCYERYFEHQHNPVRMHELVGDTTLIQWKRMIEAELEKYDELEEKRIADEEQSKADKEYQESISNEILAQQLIDLDFYVNAMPASSGFPKALMREYMNRQNKI